MIKCHEIGQYIAHLKALFMDNCKHIKPNDLEMMIDLMDAIRRCGKDSGGNGELPEDIVLYTPQEKEEYKKAIARLNIGAVSTDDVIQLLKEQLPDLLEILGVEFIINKQNNLNEDGTGTKYPTVDAVNDKFYEVDLKIEEISSTFLPIYVHFSGQTTVVVNHNLERYVVVSVLIGTEIALADVEQDISMNTVTVRFSTPQTGIIIITP